ncbi:outer membrane lipoprotein carrier protein LolA [Planctomycetota bacterium]
MQLLDNMEQEIKNLHHQASAETRQRIFSEVRQALDEHQKQQTAHRQPQIWSTIMQNKIIKYAAAAVIIIGVLATISFLGGSPDGAQTTWAKVLETFNNVQQVQGVSIKTMQDGSVVTYKTFIRKPDCLYEEQANGTIIDNGQKRLWLFKGETAVAFFPTEPIDDHEIFKIIGLFQDETLEGMTITKLDQESNDTTVVYALAYVRPSDQLSWQGKAYVDTQTNLPTKISAELTSTPKNPGEHQSEEVTFNYDPIPDDVFDITVPEGYKIVK